jgi:hypothetical protein
MSFHNRLTRTFTYWTTTPDGRGGVTFAAAATALGWWEEGEYEVNLPGGRSEISRTKVWSKDSTFPGFGGLEGWIYPGESSATDPRTVEGARRVMQSRIAYSLLDTSTAEYLMFLE